MNTTAVMGFNEVSMEEMYSVDGGLTANQWIVGSCVVAGMVVGGALGGHIGAALGAKPGSVAAIAINIATGAVVSYAAGKVANQLVK